MRRLITRIINSRYFLWSLLALPGLPMVAGLVGGVAQDGRPATEFLLHPTGEFAARFMIIAMVITPLRMLFPKTGFWRWMLARRRYFGVAAFVYALAHTLLYIVDMGNLQGMLDEFWAIGIWPGWVAFMIFVPLAITSNDVSMRLMRRAWKSLHRLVYIAAVAVLVHWIFVHNNLGPALVHYLPLAGLELYRMWHVASRSQARQELPHSPNRS